MNTIIAQIFSRDIKFKTTEKSVMASTVTDLANKAKVKVKSSASPIRRAWSKVSNSPFPNTSYNPGPSTLCRFSNAGSRLPSISDKAVC